MKYQGDIDEQVYIGDTTLSVVGLTNSTAVQGAPAGSIVASTNAATAGPTSPTGNTTSTKWIDKTPDAMLADVNAALTTCWTNSGWAIMPTEMRLPPVQFGYLVSQKVSTAGNVSILEFLRNNSLSNAAYGRPLNIQPVKWLTGRRCQQQTGCSSTLVSATAFVSRWCHYSGRRWNTVTSSS